MSLYRRNSHKGHGQLTRGTAPKYAPAPRLAEPPRPNFGWCAQTRPLPGSGELGRGRLVVDTPWGPHPHCAPSASCPQVVDKWFKSNDEESFTFARMLIAQEGLLCGEWQAGCPGGRPAPMCGRHPHTEAAWQP